MFLNISFFQVTPFSFFCLLFGNIIRQFIYGTQAYSCSPRIQPTNRNRLISSALVSIIYFSTQLTCFYRFLFGIHSIRILFSDLSLFFSPFSVRWILLFFLGFGWCSGRFHLDPYSTNSSIMHSVLLQFSGWKSAAFSASFPPLSAPPRLFPPGFLSGGYILLISKFLPKPWKFSNFSQSAFLPHSLSYAACTRLVFLSSCSVTCHKLSQTLFMYQVSDSVVATSLRTFWPLWMRNHFDPVTWKCYVSQFLNCAVFSPYPNMQADQGMIFSFLKEEHEYVTETTLNESPKLWMVYS